LLFVGCFDVNEALPLLKHPILKILASSPTLSITNNDDDNSDDNNDDDNDDDNNDAS
jgi:hypothetical protein